MTNSFVRNLGRTALAGLLAALLTASHARAAFHLWKFAEVYSDASGSVQFIEMLDASNSENQLSGRTIKSTSTGKTFTFPSNLSTTATANHRLLIATPGFASQPGAVTPDFSLPSTSFFNPAGDTLTFNGGPDTRTFASVPTSNGFSLTYPSNTTAANTPTNFSGAAGSVNRGDYNGNNRVDAADYVVWRNTVSQTPSPTGSGADGDANGAINSGDYTFWRSRFNNSIATGAGSASTAPEPANSGLLLLVLFAIRWRGRRR